MHIGLGVAIALIAGNAFTVTETVVPGNEKQPKLSVTVTLYIPEPAVEIPVLTVFCVDAVKLPGPCHKYDT
jgi:hypothetical protein